ncbi:MAG: dethiobiotin synthase [Luteolibacter sp.]|jgi:dethiobiotin synthetase
MSYFVTGTDTGVGKTYITRLLLEGMREAGIRAVGCKPLACGDRDDAAIIAAASGGLELDVVNPVYYPSPLAPYVAGLLENRPIEPKSLLGHCREMMASHDLVLVEGAGGWEVPIAPGYRISDLATDLGLPVILVVANRLGALNHSLLSIQAIRARGLECAGIILNQLEDELDTAMITNKGVIEDLCGVPLLEHLIHGQDFMPNELIEQLATERQSDPSKPNS